VLDVGANVAPDAAYDAGLEHHDDGRDDVDMADGAADAGLERRGSDADDMADAAADAGLEPHRGDDVDMADAAGIAQQRHETV
jgi:hypothetical protein